MSEKHTPGRLVLIQKPAPSFSDHGWRSIAMCGTKQMIAAKYDQVCEIKDGVVVSTRWNHEANARRLVACWNACDGLDTESIEEGDKTTSVRLMHQIRELRIQRDELLAALEVAEGSVGDLKALEIVRAAIAKVKGGAA